MPHPPPTPPRTNRGTNVPAVSRVRATDTISRTDARQPISRIGAQKALRALPARFRRPRLLVVGCGDVGLRLLRALADRIPRSLHVIAVARSESSRAKARALGARALAVDLDDRRAVRRLGALARWSVHLAPPQPSGRDDRRTAALIAASRIALRRARRRLAPARWTWVGTSGVYGDAHGERFDETRPIAPASERAHRRAAAEARLRGLSRSGLARVSILRAPGLYAHDRWPLARLRRGDPVLQRDEDVHTNHVHAEDLARIAWRALFRARPGRVYHATDDEPMRLGDYLDRVADAFDLPRPPRASRAELAQRSGGALPHVFAESRRLENRRLAQELGYRLRWPSVGAALAELGRTSRESSL